LYMAPEQISDRSATPATDIYALGAVAYHCLAGHPPFTGANALAVALRHLDDDPPPLPPDVPAAVRDLVATAMAKNPADRYPTAGALAAAAEQLTRALPPVSTAVTPVAPPTAAATGSTEAPIEVRRKRPGRRAGVLAAAAVLGLAALTAALAAADPLGTEPGPAQPPASAGPAPGSVGPSQVADASHPPARTPSGPASSTGQRSTTPVTPAGRPSATSTVRPARSPTPAPRPTSAPARATTPPSTTGPQPTTSRPPQSPSPPPSPAAVQDAGALPSPSG
jgi:serine/threonine-protein kinase